VLLVSSAEGVLPCGADSGDGRIVNLPSSESPGLIVVVVAIEALGGVLDTGDGRIVRMCRIVGVVSEEEELDTEDGRIVNLLLIESPGRVVLVASADAVLSNRAETREEGILLLGNISLSVVLLLLLGSRCDGFFLVSGCVSSSRSKSSD
jgi:hypothetical protein